MVGGRWVAAVELSFGVEDLDCGGIAASKVLLETERSTLALGATSTLPSNALAS